MRFLDDDGLPDEAFTEDEQAAGVPSLARGEYSLEDEDFGQPFDLSSIPDQGSTISKEQLTQRLLKILCEGDSWGSCSMEPHVCDPHATYPIACVDGMRDGHPWLHFYNFKLDHDFVSTKFLMDVLRESRLPLFDSYDVHLSWDTSRECLRADRRPDVKWMLSKWKGQPPESEPLRALFFLLRQAWTSSDHGFKPMLVRTGDLARAKRGGEVPLRFEETTELAAYEDYHLVYFTKKGHIRSAPFLEALTLGMPICTREGAYIERYGEVLPTMTNASLQSGAFHLAVNTNPNEFGRFEKLSKGSVFHAQYARLPPFSRHFSSQDGDMQSAVQNSEVISGDDPIDLDVLLTDGGHPLEARWVTTPALYEDAVKQLHRFGYVLDYRPLAPGVKVWTASNWMKTQVNWDDSF